MLTPFNEPIDHKEKEGFQRLSMRSNFKNGNNRRDKLPNITPNSSKPIWFRRNEAVNKINIPKINAPTSAEPIRPNSELNIPIPESRPKATIRLDPEFIPST